MSDHPLDRPDPDETAILAGSPQPRLRRSLMATHPTVLRVGVIAFIAAGVWTALLGISTNFYPNEPALENMRRVGLAGMLFSMFAILFCFPTARKIVQLPLKLVTSGTRSSVAGILILGFVFFILWLMVGVWLLWGLVGVVPTLPSTFLVLCVLSSCSVVGPVESRGFFVGALCPSGLMAIPLILPAVQYLTYGNGSLLLTNDGRMIVTLLLFLASTLTGGGIGLLMTRLINCLKQRVESKTH